MSYKAFIYAVMLILSAFSLSGLNINHIFKTNHIHEARFFMFMLMLGLAYLASAFIIGFIEAM